MGQQTLTLRQAWNVYNRWLEDPRVEFRPESQSLESRFREATAPVAARRASQWVGDCYLLACGRESGASLVTFDKRLFAFARKHGYAGILPA